MGRPGAVDHPASGDGAQPQCRPLRGDQGREIRPAHGRFVGCITAINQGDLLLGGTWSASLLWKIPLTYATPFIVATLGALGNGQAAAEKDDEMQAK